MFAKPLILGGGTIIHLHFMQLFSQYPFHSPWICVSIKRSGSLIQPTLAEIKRWLILTVFGSETNSDKKMKHCIYIYISVEIILWVLSFLSWSVPNAKKKWGLCPSLAQHLALLEVYMTQRSHLEPKIREKTESGRVV